MYNSQKNKNLLNSQRFSIQLLNIPKKPQLSENLDQQGLSDIQKSYKKRRPPDLEIKDGFEKQDGTPQSQTKPLSATHKTPISARIQIFQQQQQLSSKNSNKKIPQHFLFNNETIQHIKRKNLITGQNTTTNAGIQLKAKLPQAPQTVTGMGMDTLNEVIRKYIQAKSQKEKCISNRENTAGTGEAVIIQEPLTRVNSKSARSANAPDLYYYHEKGKKYISLSIQLFYFEYFQESNIHTNSELENLYFRASKLLNNFKAKELRWQKEKQALKDEVNFLKYLLKKSDIASSSLQQNECITLDQFQTDQYLSNDM